MADNPKDTGHPDRDLINMSEDYEVYYWSKKWGITAEQLKAAGKKPAVAVFAKYMMPQLSLVI